MTWFKRDLWAMCLLATTLAVVAGCGKTETVEKGDKKEKDGTKQKEGTNEKDAAEKPAAAAAGSPEDAFKAVKAAGEKNDYKAACESLTPESRDMLGGGLVLAGMFASFGPDGKPVKDAMEKHGLTEEVMKGSDGAPPTDPIEGMKQMLAPVKDRNQFVADMATAIASVPGGKAPPPFPADAELKDLKVDGDAATATVDYTLKGAKTSDPVTFKKADGKWLIDISAILMKQMGGGPGGPGDLPGPGELPGGLGAPTGDAPTGDAPTGDAPVVPDAGKTPEEPK